MLRDTAVDNINKAFNLMALSQGTHKQIPTTNLDRGKRSDECQTKEWDRQKRVLMGEEGLGDCR